MKLRKSIALIAVIEASIFLPSAVFAQQLPQLPLTFLGGFSGVPVLSTVVLDPLGFLEVGANTGTSIISSPENLLDTVMGVGLALGPEFSPAFGVLIENPEGIVDFFMSGGVLVTPSVEILSTLLPLPLVNQPLTGL